MKKLIGILLLVYLVPFFVAGKGKNSNSVLRFNEDGKFKIVQFTDVHYRSYSYRSDSSLVLMRKVIELEKPDLVVLTGDIVTSKQQELSWRELSQVMIDAQVPWAFTLGNHDPETKSGANKEEVMKAISGLPYNLTSAGPGNIAGKGNYILKVKSSSSNKPAALFYFLDSHLSIRPKGELGSYEWIKFDQINWYQKQSKRFTKKNNGEPYPALAFFHIPLPEYKEVIGKETTFGIAKERVSCPDLNSGFYTAMLESKDVMGVFVGHDHNNNYIGCLRGICLAYGNATGRQCYGRIGKGARVIELYEGERKFSTWILNMYECDRDEDIWIPTNDYSKKFYVTYPDSFKE